MINPNHMRNMIYGAVVGDCLGVPYEMVTREKMKENPCTDMVGNLKHVTPFGPSHDKPKGTWSDDTSMALILLDTILEKKCFDIQYFGIQCLLWLEGNRYTSDGVAFGTGGTTRDALKKFKEGVNPYDCGGKEKKNNGNGGLMRCYPLLLLTEGKSLAETLLIVREANRLTHDTLLSHLCVTFYLRFLERLCKIQHAFTCFAITLEEFKSLGCPEEFMNSMNDILMSIPPDSSKIKSNPYILSTLQASLWCLLRGSSYKECVLMAVNLGGDTDTTAAVTGALAGCLYGDVPQEWIDSIVNKELIIAYVIKFLMSYQDIKKASVIP